MRNVYFIALTWALAIFAACRKEEPRTKPAPDPKDPGCNPTYVSDIKRIAEARCAISGCHDGISGIAGFKEYAPLKERVDNGKVRSYALELKIMPPAGKPQLTGEEKKLLECWLDNGAPEN